MLLIITVDFFFDSFFINVDFHIKTVMWYLMCDLWIWNFFIHVHNTGQWKCFFVYLIKSYILGQYLQCSYIRKCNQFGNFNFPIKEHSPFEKISLLVCSQVYFISWICINSQFGNLYKFVNWNWGKIWIWNSIGKIHGAYPYWYPLCEIYLNSNPLCKLKLFSADY
jgi:hypothetical protein